MNESQQINIEQDQTLPTPPPRTSNNEGYTTNRFTMIKNIKKEYNVTKENGIEKEKNKAGKSTSKNGSVWISMNFLPSEITT